jgi:hypothetical protein
MFHRLHNRKACMQTGLGHRRVFPSGGTPAHDKTKPRSYSAEQAELLTQETAFSRMFGPSGRQDRTGLDHAGRARAPSGAAGNALSLRGYSGIM